MKKLILDTVEDLVQSLLYTDRKEDEELPRGVIELAIENGDITIDDIVENFKQNLIEGVE